MPGGRRACTQWGGRADQTRNGLLASLQGDCLHAALLSLPAVCERFACNAASEAAAGADAADRVAARACERSRLARQTKCPGCTCGVLALDVKVYDRHLSLLVVCRAVCLGLRNFWPEGTRGEHNLPHLQHLPRKVTEGSPHPPPNVMASPITPGSTDEKRRVRVPGADYAARKIIGQAKKLVDTQPNSEEMQAPESSPRRTLSHKQMMATRTQHKRNQNARRSGSPSPRASARRSWRKRSS